MINVRKKSIMFIWRVNLSQWRNVTQRVSCLGDVDRSDAASSIPDVHNDEE